MLYLVEDFYSVQGEGKFVGTPTIFLRFGGCNLKCPNFGEYIVKGKKIFGCDSVRAVNREIFEKDWRVIEDSKELLEIVEEYKEHLDFQPHVVLTGGEPLIYWNDPVFYSFLDYLIKEEYIVTIETNSTIKIDFEKYPLYQYVIFAMAVKLSNSGEKYEKRVNKAAIEAMATKSSYSFFKFTLDRNIIDFSAYDEIVDIVADYPDVEVFCMPKGDSIEEIKRHDKAVAEFCMVYGFIYSDRLQVRLWNREKRR